MLDRLKAALRALRTDQRRVVLAAAAVLGSLLLPWYTKTAVVAPNPQASEKPQLAILTPSLIEASIMLVGVAVLALMLARGAQAKFFLPIPDRILVMAAGAWTFLLVFYRFVDQPEGKNNARIVTEYQLSWGIFFGLVAATLLFASGHFLHEERGVDPEPLPEPLPEPPRAGGPNP